MPRALAAQTRACLPGNHRSHVAVMPTAAGALMRPGGGEGQAVQNPSGLKLCGCGPLGMSAAGSPCRAAVER